MYYKWLRLALKISAVSAIILLWFLPLNLIVGATIFAISGAALLGIAVFDFIVYRQNLEGAETKAVLLTTFVSVITPIVLTGLFLFSPLSFLSAPFMPIIVMGTLLGGMLFPILIRFTFRELNESLIKEGHGGFMDRVIRHIFGGVEKGPFGLGKTDQQSLVFESVSMWIGLTGIAFFLGAGIGLALETYVPKQALTVMLTTLGTNPVVGAALALAILTTVIFVVTTIIYANWTNAKPLNQVADAPPSGLEGSSNHPLENTSEPTPEELMLQNNHSPRVFSVSSKADEVPNLLPKEDSSTLVPTPEDLTLSNNNSRKASKASSVISDAKEGEESDSSIPSTTSTHTRTLKRLSDATTSDSQTRTRSDSSAICSGSEDEGSDSDDEQTAPEHIIDPLGIDKEDRGKGQKGTLADETTEEPTYEPIYGYGWT